MDERKKLTLAAVLIVSIGSLLYFYEFFMRTVPNTLGDEISQYLQLSLVQEGWFKSAFYLGYIPMQLFAGLLIDRHGPKRWLISGALVCSLCLLVFYGVISHATAWSYPGLLLARFCAGVASSFAYIGPLMLMNIWVPHRYFATGTGLVQLTGNMGALLATSPILWVFEQYGLATAFLTASGAGVIIALSMLAIRNTPRNESLQSFNHNLNSTQRLKKVLRNKQLLWIACIGFVSWVPMAALAETWGKEFLGILWQQHNSHQLTSWIAWIWLGNIFGGPILGWSSEYFKCRKTPIILCFLSSILLLLYIFFLGPTNPTFDACIFALLGFSSGIQVVTFGLVSDVADDDVMATAIGFNNMAVAASGLISVVLPALMQTMHHASSVGISRSELQTALLLIPTLLILSVAILYYRINETRAEKQDKSHAPAN